MARFDEAIARKQNNIFICRTCKSKIRASSLKVSQGKISCRKCSAKKLRPKRKK